MTGRLKKHLERLIEDFGAVYVVRPLKTGVHYSTVCFFTFSQ